MRSARVAEFVETRVIELEQDNLNLAQNRIYLKSNSVSMQKLIEP